MNYWNAILSSSFSKFSFRSADQSEEAQKPAAKAKTIRSRVMKVYYLDNQNKSLYLTHREAECMLNIIKGCTIRDVSERLKLSARTVEFYVKNIKKKLGCRTKSELIQRIYNSDFMKNVDF